MEDNYYKGIIESLLFVSGSDGLSKKQIQATLEISPNHVQQLIQALKDEYQDPSRGIQLIEADDNYYLSTKGEHADYLSVFVTSNHNQKLSQASLETLAIIAYNQPITRLEIEEVRGVKSDRPVQTLLSRGLIEEAGRKEAIGRPTLFKTSVEFLTYFNLKSIEELPPLTEQPDSFQLDGETDLFFNQLNEFDEG